MQAQEEPREGEGVTPVNQPRPQEVHSSFLPDLSMVVREMVRGAIREQLGDVRPSAQEAPPPKKARTKSKHIEASSVSSSEGEDTSPIRHKGFHKPARHQSQEDSLSSHSESDKEDGALSGGEQDTSSNPKVDRLCPPDLYTRVLTKSATAMELAMPAAPDKPDTPLHRAKSYPMGPSKPQVVPFPEALGSIFDTEWSHFHHSKQHAKLMDKLYTLPEQIMNKLKVPTVDAPVVAVSASTVLPSEGESGPRDACDRKIEGALKRGFEFNSQSFRVAVTSSIFSRAAYIWAEELAQQDKSLSRKTRCTLKKIAMASAAAADCAYDSLQLSSRSMAMGVLARRHLWLRQWEGDASSTSRVVNIPFRGEKLFGEALEPLLIENKDKQKVLPTKKKEPPRRVQSFRQSGQGYKSRGFSARNKPKWDKSRVQFKKKGGQSTASTGKSGKDTQSA